MGGIKYGSLCKACLTAFLSIALGAPAWATQPASNPPDSAVVAAAATSAAASEYVIPTHLASFYARWGIALSCEKNIPFYAYLKEWLYRTPYRYGGNARSGTDCSGFVQTFCREFYGVSLERAAGPQLGQCLRIRNRADLREGDLLFFSWNNGGYIMHVGIYLGNDLFVHSASSRGVIISSLQEPYYKKFYHAGGRLGITPESHPQAGI